MFKEIPACRLCGNPHLRSLLDLGHLGHTGVFPRTDDPDAAAGPLELVKCWGDRGAVCGLVQLRHSFDAAALYGDNYGYRSGLNRSMVEHLAAVVARAAALVGLRPGDLVLDIGSNDGSTLGLYGRQDLDLVGVDPCGPKFARHYPPHVRLIPDFFSAAAVRRHVGARRARVITSIAMFYDLEAPLAFACDVHDLLAEDGVWVVEQSYLPTMVARNAYDTICHEHLEYYALRQIQWVTDRAGLKILDVGLNEVNGGSFQVTAARADAPYPENTERVARLLAGEEAGGFDDLGPYWAFRDRIFAHRRDLLDFVNEARRRGQSVLGYGASTKGNVVLQFCGLTAEHLPCIAEVNEDKFGCLTPSSRIPIVSEAEARARRPDYFLVLPWHFREAILRREQAYLQGGGRLVFPLPTIEVVGREALSRAA
jgi:NDP-4-keto-2,6-dideoxyhexose 3-C-methyltransferase